MAFNERQQLLLGDSAGRQLGAQVAQHQRRHSDIGFEQRKQGGARNPFIVELERRDPQPFLIDLGGVRGVRTGDSSADVGVVAASRRERDALVAMKDRLQHEDIGQMGATLEGIVEDEHIAGMNVPLETAQHRFERIGHRA